MARPGLEASLKGCSLERGSGPRAGRPACLHIWEGRNRHHELFSVILNLEVIATHCGSN